MAFKCNICNIDFDSQSLLNVHLTSNTHKKNIVQVMNV
jgi:hypothetical protein